MMKKRILCIFLSALCIFCCGVYSCAAVSGDVNGDGKVAADDARLTLRFSVNLEKPTTAQKQAADFDTDGSITAADARLILRYAVGLDNAFSPVLYNYAHQYVGMSADELPSNGSVLEKTYRTSGKWCCYYTVHDVFRPALRLAGYSEERIEQLAPTMFDSKKIVKAVNSLFNSTEAQELTEEEKEAYSKWEWTASFIPSNFRVYMPSLLVDYYNTHPEYCTVYNFYEYYDDVITDKLIKTTSNTSSYEPKVGDVVFMTNKTRTYVNGIPTVDHTAQIIQVNNDGTFVCTEGGIIVTNDVDNLARVRERTYYFNAELNTYQYTRNSVVYVLSIARPFY